MDVSHKVDVDTDSDSDDDGGKLSDTQSQYDEIEVRFTIQARAHLCVCSSCWICPSLMSACLVSSTVRMWMRRTNGSFPCSFRKMLPLSPHCLTSSWNVSGKKMLKLEMSLRVVSYYSIWGLVSLSTVSNYLPMHKGGCCLLSLTCHVVLAIIRRTESPRDG